jgi:hypothetical protein
MDDDKRDELLIRMDERTGRMSDDIKELKSETKSTHQRLDIIETKMTMPQIPAPSESKVGLWASMLEFIAAAPAAWHIVGSALLAGTGTLLAVLAWLGRNAAAAGGGK